MAAVDEDDVFWEIQLSGDVEASSAIKPWLTSEVQWSDHQDCALPAGTELTDASLARVLGDVQDVSIPMMANRFDASRSVRQREPMLLSIRLRQVNGEGVMSGVGGDVWSAALLLSAWLLTNPEVIRDQAILELGSGLGLCGIVAGYLSESVILTDYVDELLVNLHHNIEINRKPRIVPEQNSLLSPEDGVFCCDYPPRCRLGIRETDGDDTSATVDQASQGLCVSSQGLCVSSQGLCVSSQGLCVSSQGLCVSSQGLCVSPHPFPSEHDTAVRLESSWLEPERYGHPNVKSSETCENLSSISASIIGGCVPLQPLQRMSVRKVDWNAYTARHPAVDNARKDEGSSKFWWDDEGPRAGGSGTPAASGTVGLEPLRCDVIIGSALIYSPHHACVADVLWHAFTGGGCRVAYIVQLSTRPGFDEFLQRLDSLGLRYRLQKISAALPFPLCNELRRRASVDVVGGPVTRSSNDYHDEQARTSPEEGREFDEFVLCKVFHASKM